MKCPSCGNAQKYKEGFTCGSCKYKFVFDPKRDNIADGKFVAMVKPVSQDGERLESEMNLDVSYENARGTALRASLIPITNSLLAVGLVSLPGMMTGQILAGIDPVIAIKYQIVVMLMLVASTAIGSTIVAHVVRRLCFTRSSQLILR